jgi:hypothetical protein
MDAGFLLFPPNKDRSNMRASTTTRNISAEQLSSDKLAVYSVGTTKAGKVRSITAYIDLNTGEIIPADQLSIPTLDLREKLFARRKALESLRAEVRLFAVFVLHFANKRRGITPGVDTLCRWYADMQGKRSQDVRRYVPKLMEAGLLAGENLLGPLFQRTGGRVKDHLGEEFRAGCLNARMRWRSKVDAEASAQQAAWDAIRKAARQEHATAGA